MGGFLDDIAGFDAGFFRISPREARCMDPQQRLLMEVVHHAIEDSGAPVERLRELDCGIICAGLPGDYKHLLATHPDLVYSSQSFSGNAMASLSGRIAYFYDFRGPSLTLDTACSSSLTALQVACLQLQAGTCGAMVLGASSVFATPELFEFTRRAGMLSTKGRCAAFGQDADGFVPAEGIAALVLTTEANAAALGLRILATIEAFGINHNGASPGLMAPSARSQAELITRTYRRFGIHVSRIGYVEAHGTGTPIGDPAELAGLVQAYQDMEPGHQTWLGASKTVIGHTLVCSGLASLLKAILILQHGSIPPHPIPMEDGTPSNLGGFILNGHEVPWPVGRDLVAISAFGFTGSNGHVVLGKAPGQTKVDCGPGGSQPSYPFKRKPYWVEALAPEPPVFTPLDPPGNGKGVTDSKTGARANPQKMRWQPPSHPGQAILLLPPLNMGSNAWKQQIHALVRQGYAPHLAVYPGHLDNPMPSHPLQWQGLVEDIVNYLRAELGGKAVPLFGWSLGGTLSLGVAAYAPEVVSSLVLVSTAARFGDELFGRTVELQQELHAAADYLDIVLKPGGSMIEQVGAGAGLDILSQYYRMLGEVDLTPALPSIVAQTLIVHGRRDPVIRDHDLALLRKLPHVRIREFEREGHFIPLLAARRFNDLALSFLSEIGARPSYGLGAKEGYPAVGFGRQA
jgi:3-oxoacyl-(acyl-carrier-protein) synthase/pimeloyl-ACP methyl ester carboxylesterase